jgi:hypothetical protein
LKDDVSVRQAKAASHPLRLRILRLCGQPPMTNKQLTDRLDHLMSARESPSFAVYGAGALAGGALGTAVGLRPALLACAVGALLSPLLALCSPLRQLRQQPTSDRLTF